MRRRCWRLLPMLLVWVVSACGGGATAPVQDASPSDIAGPDDLKPGVDAKPDVPGDLAKPDVPADDAPDAVGRDDAVPDQADEGEEVPPSDVPECVVDDDCKDKVGDLAACEVARCEGGKCVKALAADGTPCDDAEPCTTDDRCVAGVCKGQDEECDDGEVCTQDFCEPGKGCKHDPMEGPCDDGSRCTEDDACLLGECVGVQVDCDDKNPCTLDGCDPASGCKHVKLDGDDCDDGSVCTKDDACVDGQCKGTQVGCDDQNVCTRDTCDPAEGCKHEAAPGKCDDGESCTKDDQCDQGECKGTVLDCDDGDPCSDDACEEGKGCVHVENQAPCDDLNACTKDDKCVGGICKGEPEVCGTPPPNECIEGKMVSYALQGVCGPGGCDYPKQEVECSQGCENGKCIGDPCEGLDCTVAPGQCYEAPGTCVDGRCDYEYAEQKPCEDDNLCTEGDACASGVCVGVPVLCNDPPPDECADAKTVLAHEKQGQCDPGTGGCWYDVTPVPCTGGCVDGICLEALGLLQADLDPGGQTGMTAGTQAMSCVLPGWAGGDAMKSATFMVEAGFEP